MLSLLEALGLLIDVFQFRQCNPTRLLFLKDVGSEEVMAKEGRMRKDEVEEQQWMALVCMGKKKKLVSNQLHTVVYFNAGDPPALLLHKKEKKSWFSFRNRKPQKPFPEEKNGTKEKKYQGGGDSGIRPILARKTSLIKASDSLGLMKIEDFHEYETPPTYVFGTRNSKFYRLTKRLMEEEAERRTTKIH